MTLPLFLRAFNGGDDTEHARRFHRRLVTDTATETTDAGTRAHAAPASSAVIDGTPVPELLTRLRAGDRTALATLYHALFEPLWRVAVLQTQAGDAAEDVVHDVFLWMWTHRESLAPHIDIRVYLSTAVRNRARNLGKHARLVDTAATHESVAIEVSGLGAPTPPTDAAVETDEFTIAYQRALSLLTERELTAALLRWEEGFTLEQIGHVLSVSARGALGVVTRAQQKVQDALQAFR